MEPMNLNIILYQEGPYWVGKCLELDILTSGRDKDVVMKDVVDICTTQVAFAIENDRVGDMFRPPDQRLTDRFWKSMREHGSIQATTREVDDTTVQMRMVEAGLS